MSDILIRGMEMPTSCGRCRFAGVCGVHPVDEWPDLESIITNDVIGVDGERDKRCPLVPLPPHGDLIDLSAKVDCQYYDEEHEEWTVETVTVEQVLHGCLEKMPPVIVPASEEATNDPQP